MAYVICIYFVCDVEQKVYFGSAELFGYQAKDRINDTARHISSELSGESEVFTLSSRGAARHDLSHACEKAIKVLS